MSVPQATQLADLEGIVVRRLTLAGGSFKVLLLYRGTELSGHGYSRKTVSTFGAAQVHSSGLYCVKNSTPVTFAASSSGELKFDEIQTRNKAGTEIIQSCRSPQTVVISAGGNRSVTITFRTN